MPFTMIHLGLAAEIAKRRQEIVCVGDFLKGAIAPDAIHVRNNYHSDMKKKSHLVVGDEAWGQVTNNDQWVTSVTDFLKRHIRDENRDFLYGYCVHIMTDIQNNRKVWQPFYEKNKTLFEIGKGSVYHSESAVIDQVLYQVLPEASELVKEMMVGKGVTLEGLVTSEEIDLFVDSMIKGRYKKELVKGYDQHKYVKLEDMLVFIKEEALYIEETLFGIPSI